MFVNYDYYRIFYYVAKYGNLSQAARVLLSNQPNLTRTVKNLENELGCTLFFRTNRGMRLTPEGEKLFQHVKVALEHLEAGEAEITETKNLQSGTVFIAATEVALRCLLLSVLNQYRRLYPGIRLRISNHSAPQAIAAVREGTADLALVTTPFDHSPALQQKTLKPFREAAVCSDAFPELLGRSVALEELQKYPLISLGNQTGSFSFYSNFFNENDLRYSPDIEAATSDQILPMVEAGLGIGFVPEEIIRPDDAVRRLQLNVPIPPREICMLKRKDQTLGVAAKALEQLLSEV